MDQLEKYFETAFGAPDGVNQLRGLILTIALQGKLVPQDPLDKPSGEVLQSLKLKYKEKYAEFIKSNKRTRSVNQESIPYDIPSNWKWVALSEIGEINPRNTVDENLDAGFVPMPLIKTKYGIPHSFEVRKWKLIRSGYTHFSNGDVGLAKITPCFENAKSCVFNNLPNAIGAGTTELHIFRNTFELVEPEFLLAYFKSPKFISEGTKIMTGSAGQKRVPTDYFSTNPFPLPPFKEQQRIVNKIDQLMSRCDELEKLRAERDQKRLDVHTAAIRKMLDAPNQATFDNAWQFITRHFGDLYTVRENVAELRKAILQLGVMGKLVPQDPKEGTARELLEEIEREKRKMLKEGKMKGKASFSSIKVEEVPYNLPHSWLWTRLGNAGELERGKSKHRPRNDRKLFINGNYPLVQTGDVSKSKNTNHIILTYGKQYNEFGLSQSRLWDEGTLCITIAANIAETGFLGMQACIPDSIVAFKSIDKSMTKFVKYFIEVAKEDLENFAPSTAQKNINLEILNDLVFPLPPLKEQRRIILKIEALMDQCDLLEQSIEMSIKKKRELLGAVMDEFA